MTHAVCDYSYYRQLSVHQFALARQPVDIELQRNGRCLLTFRHITENFEFRFWMFLPPKLGAPDTGPHTEYTDRIPEYSEVFQVMIPTEKDLPMDHS